MHHWHGPITQLLVEERVGRLLDEAAAARKARSVARERSTPQWLSHAAAYLRPRRRRRQPCTPVRVTP